MRDSLDPWRVRKYPYKYGAETIPPGIAIVVVTPSNEDLVFRFENFGESILLLAVKTEFLGVDPSKCIILHSEDIVVRTVKKMTTIYALAPNATPGCIKVDSQTVDHQSEHPLFVGLEADPPGQSKGRREWKEPNE